MAFDPFGKNIWATPEPRYTAPLAFSHQIEEIDRTIERLSQQSAQPVQPVQPVQSVAYSPVGASQVSHLGQAQPGQLGQPGQSVRSQPVRQVSMHHVQAHPRAGTLGTRSVSGPVNFQRPAYSGSAAHVWGSSGLTTVWG